MAALGDVTASLRAALDRLPSAGVIEARTRLLDQLVPEFDQLTTGTSNQELVEARARLSAAVRSLERASELLGVVTGHTQDWLAEHTAVEPTPSPETSTSPPRRGDETTARVTTYRARLENPWPYGTPLRGWRLGTTGDDDTALTSGTKLESGETDPAYSAAVDKATALGLALGGFVPDIARHIEIKEAATMREGETRTIVIGKDPCGIDPVTNVSYHRFLRYFLPANATLIVYGPTSTPYRYEGTRT